MKRVHKDGLLLDNSILIFDEKKSGIPIYSRIMQFLAILIGSWSSIGLLMEAMAVPADYLKVNLMILICTGILYTLCILSSLDLVKIFFGVFFYGLFFISRLKQLQNGFFILENLVLERISNYYEINTIRFLADYSNMKADMTLIMIMITIPVVTLLSIAVIRNHLVSLVGVILFLPVILTFGFGLIPAERYLIAYLVAVLYMSRSSCPSHKANHRDQKLLLHRINSGAAIWLSTICIALFFLLKLFLTEEKYSELSKIPETKQELQQAMYNISWEDLSGAFSDIYLFPDQRAVGGLNGGQLGRVGKVEYTESEQLRVTAPKRAVASGVYLKGYVGSVYTGTKWEEHGKKMSKAYKDLSMGFTQKDFQPENLLSLFLSNIRNVNLSDIDITDEMYVEYEAANKEFIYIPYVTDYLQQENIKYVQDLYAAPEKKRKSYTVNFDSRILSTGSNNSLFKYIFWNNQMNLGDNSENERLYQEFVQKAYLQLPEEGVDRLIKEFSEVQVEPSLGIVPGADQDLRLLIDWANPEIYRKYAYQIAKITYVMDYLSSNATYSLSPGKLPSDKDFVEYFLYENKKGYCSHFASAATLMLRAMNVPARYVEGYAVSSSDIDKNTLTASNAEETFETVETNNSREMYSSYNINIDNTILEFSVKDYNAHAWVEVYLNGVGWIPVDFTPSASIGSSPFGSGSNGNQDNTPTRAPYVNSQEKPTPTSRPTPLPQKPNTDKSNDNKADQNSGVSKSEKEKLDLLFLQVFLALIIGGVTVTIIYLKIKNKNSQNTRNHNREAIVLYRKIEKILAICHELGKRGARLEDLEEYVKSHCSYMDPEAFTTCMEIVRRARFGKGRITQEELTQVENLYHDLYEKAYDQQALHQKIFMKVVFSYSIT